MKSKKPFQSRYHESRIQYMAKGKSPSCDILYSQKPYWEDHRLIFPFLIDNWQHFYYVDFPQEFNNIIQTPSSILIGIAMAEIYRLCEICIPKVVKISWYNCLQWESDWWNEDIYWYLQQKFYLEKWDWEEIPKIKFSENHSIESESNLSFCVQNSYLLAVSGGKESTFSFEWMQQANLSIEAFTLHNAGGILGHSWQQKFPVFNYIKNQTHLWEIQAHPQEDPAIHFNYQGVRNDPTITNALFIMMIIAIQQGHRFLVLANDKSSNESNAIYQGREVNHQSAKGNAYIAHFNNFLKCKGLPFEYVSICEEVYSIGAVQQLSIWNKNILKELTSCNESQWDPKDIRWCCECPKCAFSYALLEAVTDSNFAQQVVGKDLFNVVNLKDTWRRLFNLDAEKPFECVGEKRETLMALTKCKKQRLEQNQPLGILAEIPNIDFDQIFMKIYPPHNIPLEDQTKLNSVLID